jgi:hypothetical protein
MNPLNQSKRYDEIHLVYSSHIGESEKDEFRCVLETKNEQIAHRYFEDTYNSELLLQHALLHLLRQNFRAQ